LLVVSATTFVQSGFGEFEAEGGLGGQDDLLVPGVHHSGHAMLVEVLPVGKPKKIL
jgi:hypothetical protein